MTGAGILFAGLMLPCKVNAAAKPLVVYFSRTGEQFGVGVISKGNTAITAEIIAQKTGADLCEISVVNDSYPRDYKSLCDVAKAELNSRARPEYTKSVPDISSYDTLFIGAPVWWGDWPMVMYTFFDNENLAGKTLIPFSTHAGSGLAGFDKKLAAACPKSRVSIGLAITGSDAQRNKERVEQSVDGWLKKLVAQGIRLK